MPIDHSSATMTTIHEASQSQDVIIFVFVNRPYCIGDTAYRVTRKRFDNGMRETMPLFAKCWPVMWIDGQWCDIQRQPIITNWSRSIQILD